MKEYKLYNVIFPLWMLMLFPQVWLIVWPGNFIIDSLVLLIAMAVWKIPNKKEMYKKHILKIFLFGMLSDAIGSAYMLLMIMIPALSDTANELYLTVPALILTGVLIYVFNYYITFKKTDMILRKKLALTFAIATAPYTFLFPTTWLY